MQALQALRVAGMTYEHLLDLDELEEMVARIKARYIEVRDAHLPSAPMWWNEYARVLYVLRLRKRSMKYDG